MKLKSRSLLVGMRDTPGVAVALVVIEGDWHRLVEEVIAEYFDDSIGVLGLFFVEEYIIGDFGANGDFHALLFELPLNGVRVGAAGAGREGGANTQSPRYWVIRRYISCNCCELAFGSIG